MQHYKPLFLEALEKQRGYSTATIKTYGEVLQEALEFVEYTQESPDDPIVLNLMPYRLHIAHLNPKTITKKLSALRGFAEFLNQRGVAVVLKADTSVKVAKTLPKPVQHTHIVEVLQEATLQEKVIVMMLYTLGLRISELSGLRVEDVNGAWVRVMGKGGKQRDVPLLSTTKTVLEEYLQTFTPKRFVFEKNGERLSENSLRYTINKLFAKRGLKVTPHQLRHSYATALLNGGAPIVDVSELLGHSSMATTQIYTKLGSALKKQNYQKAHPLCGVSK
jgi:integrase/recombinase XerC